MKNSLLNKLLINALEELVTRLDYDGCNDLEMGSPELKGISDAEFENIQDEWRKEFPKEAADYEGNLRSNIPLIKLLILKLKNKAKIAQ